MKQIPRIIHQIWSDKGKSLPEYFSKMAETWKYDYPDWEYLFWDDNKMNSFILEYFPQYWEAYNGFPYNVQRWDAVRYLILYKIGGMYVDFDFESLKPMDELLLDKQCCFSKEPLSHCNDNHKLIINNSIMASVSGHIYMKKIIDKMFSKQKLELSLSAYDKANYVFETTGQWMLVDVYENLTLEERSSVYLISPSYINPFDLPRANIAKRGHWDKRLEDSIKEAYAIHYYFGTWVG